MVPPPRLLTRAFALLVSAHFMQALGYATMLLLPVYLVHLGENYETIGWVMSIASVGGLLTRPAVAIALDRWGRRPTIFVGTTLVGLSMIGLVTIRSVGLPLYLLRVSFGIGVGALFTAYFAFASDLVPQKRRTEGLALFGVSGLVPLLVNPLSEWIGIDAAGLRLFFPVIGCVVLLSMLPVVPLAEPLNRITRPKTTLAEVIQALRQRDIIPVWIATVVFSGLVAISMTFATVMGKRRAIESPTDFWTMYAAGAVTVRLFGARIPDRLGPRNLVGPSLAIFCIGLLCLAASWNHRMLCIAGIFCGMGHGYCFPVLSSQVATRIPENLRGAGFAMFTAIWGVSALVTPLYGAIGDRLGDSVMFALCVLVSLVGLAIWLPVEHFWSVKSSASS